MSLAHTPRRGGFALAGLVALALVFCWTFSVGAELSDDAIVADGRVIGDLDQGVVSEPVGEGSDQLNEGEVEEEETPIALAPEPSTLVMLILAAVTAYLWRRKW